MPRFRESWYIRCGMTSSGITSSILSSTAITDLAWTGRHLWVATADGGMTRVADPAGAPVFDLYANSLRSANVTAVAGLVSTADDYARFLQMLLNGGALGDARILSPKSVQLMTSDHLGDRYGSAGMGFGLGFSVLEDLGARGTPGSEGEFGWGGAYHSTYWIDPAEELVVAYFTQVIPAAGLDDHARLRALVYQAVEDSAVPLGIR